MNRNKPWVFAVVTIAATLLAAGCSLPPAGARQESARAAEAGKVYAQRFEDRTLPELPDSPQWQDLLHRAFLANGELEAAYFDWAAAVARIKAASAYPNTNLTLGFDYMFSRERMKAWDRTTLSAGLDPAMMLQWPGKVRQAGKVALADAQTRGQRLAAAKFALQERVLTMWLDYAWIAQQQRIGQENVELLKMVLDTAAQRVRTGGPQADLLRAQTEYELARNELANLESQAAQARAKLNGMLARLPEASLAAPAELPAPRRVASDDAALIAAAVDANPDLAALAHEVAGRADALELARMAYIPDFSPQFSLTGNVSQAVGMMVSLPTNLARIRASIREAQAMLRGTEALARQTRSDRAAAFVASLYAMRNYERQIPLFEQTILPAAEQALQGTTRAYAAGTMTFGELVEAVRTVLEARLLVVEARIEREKRLAAMETLAGVDVETLGRELAADERR